MSPTEQWTHLRVKLDKRLQLICSRNSHEYSPLSAAAATVMRTRSNDGQSDKVMVTPTKTRTRENWMLLFISSPVSSISITCVNSSTIWDSTCYSNQHWHIHKLSGATARPRWTWTSINETKFWFINLIAYIMQSDAFPGTPVASGGLFVYRLCMYGTQETNLPCWVLKTQVEKVRA